jgi:hypothetical protein
VSHDTSKITHSYVAEAVGSAAFVILHASCVLITFHQLNVGVNCQTISNCLAFTQPVHGKKIQSISLVDGFTAIAGLLTSTGDAGEEASEPLIYTCSAHALICSCQVISMLKDIIINYST